MFKSKNIGLRPIEQRDITVLTELANDTLIATMVVGWSNPVSEVQQAQWIASQHTSTTTVRLVVVDLATDEAIGVTGLWDIDWHNQSAMTATKLLPSKVKKGFGTESIMLTMAWAFYNVGLRRLYGSILDFNGPSMAAYVKKCGWRIEGCNKEAIFRKGRWCDLYQVAILKTDFDKLHNIIEFIDGVYPGDVQDILIASDFVK